MENKFLKIKKADNHEYFYAERLGVDSVAFILQKLVREGDKLVRHYGLIKEFKPPIGEFVITAFGGSIDKNKSLTEIVIEEAKEEAGYVVTPYHIFPHGKRFVSTQMNQWCYLFLVDVTNIEQGEREPETYLESVAEVVWLKKEDINDYDFQDWKAQAILSTVFEWNKE